MVGVNQLGILGETGTQQREEVVEGVLVVGELGEVLDLLGDGING